MRDMYDQYIYPQLMERRPYEALWDDLLDMYRINMKRNKLHLGDDADKFEERMAEQAGGSDRAQVSDSLIFDAVDRLKNLNHFISWKDGIPVQYAVDAYYSSSKENEFYHPLADRVDSANSLLKWNVSTQDVYRKHLLLAGHHYLYGSSFAISELEFQTKEIPKREGNNIVLKKELVKVGVTFEPISIRKLWLNYRVNTYDMEDQSCPFFYEVMPRHRALTNVYDPVGNPFGFANLESLQNAQWLFSQEEAQSMRTAVETRIRGDERSGLAELGRPEFFAEAKWTLYPMLPLDPETGEYKTRKDGSVVPMMRYIVELFGSNLRDAQMLPVRIQQNFYPMGRLPLYASVHMPDLDSGVYGMAIGEVLKGHYEQICTIINQMIDNKNLINNPPSWSVLGSPCSTQDRNRPGADISVTGPNDCGWRQVYDASGSSVPMLTFLRDRAQTTSKAVDAILGKALGGRTSATEAQNVFQAAMSGVTTDINIFNYDIMGGYAMRSWEIAGLWFSPTLIKYITGQYGAPLTVEDLQTKIGLKWDVGSAFIESIVKQGHLRYALEAASRSPALRQDILWREFFKELKMTSLQEAVIDNGFANQVQLATEQSIQTYLGHVVTVNPAQDHNIAIEVKSRFVEDIESNWNKEYGQLPSAMPSMQGGGPQSRGQALIEQIQIHQQIAMMQMQQQIALAQQQAQIQDLDNQKEPPPGKQSGEVATTGGQARQQTGQ
jgi:hypothetical protein